MPQRNLAIAARLSNFFVGIIQSYVPRELAAPTAQPVYSIQPHGKLDGRAYISGADCDNFKQIALSTNVPLMVSIYHIPNYINHTTLYHLEAMHTHILLYIHQLIFTLINSPELFAMQKRRHLAHPLSTSPRITHPINQVTPPHPRTAQIPL